LGGGNRSTNMRNKAQNREDTFNILMSTRIYSDILVIVSTPILN